MRIRVALLCVVLSSCARHTGDGDDTQGPYAMVQVAPDPLALTVPIGSTVTQEYRVYGGDTGNMKDITTECTLALASADFGDFNNSATLTAAPHGGVTQVLAQCGEQAASAMLTIDLNGTVVVGPGVPANAKDLFDNATAGADPSRTPAIEYPLDQAVAPINIPPMEMQWAAGASNDLFHLTLVSSHAHVDVYVAAREATLALPNWTSIVGTAVGEKLAITVEGLAQSAPQTKFASTPVALALSHDTIDTSAIYWWASSQGSIMSQTFGNVTAPTQVLGNCSGCHSLSRAGSRIAYSRCVAGQCNGEWVGFMKFDSAQNTWSEVVNADNETIAGTYATFSPVGNPFPDDTHALALVTSMSGTFNLYDPDTGTGVASNLSTIALPNRSATMPDWSSDGTKVVFASTAHAGQSVDVSDSSIAVMSYANTGGAHTFGTPTMLVSAPLTVNGQSYTNLFFPSFSPDGQLVVFNAARATWRNFADARTAGQRLMLVNPSAGAPIDLAALNGPGDQDITWPHWAPGSTTDYYWIVFSSERDYGHEVTATHTAAPCVANGVKQCKQIWIGAISKAALMSGTVDPSFAPVWVPGQDTNADNISPYWTKPAGIF